ncbi:MAG TPA: hypothetical protein PLN53_11360 [Terricaulis sp.]|nr:hypothetical protein [Terricaulis sp.]
MPKADLRAVALSALCLSVIACAAPSGPSAPREIRTGAAETAAQYVESSVSPEEVAAAVQAMIAVEPICASWPTLWLQDGGRRTLFIVRYDLMARDWGADVAANSQGRMNEFVASGFLTERARSDIGPGVVEYVLTPAGDQAMSGSPYSGERPNFCAPAERRLVSVTAMEWGQYECGNLRVRFEHVGDDWPSWARAQATRDRLAQSWPAVGAPAQGTVTLSRRWFSESANGMGRGELASVCYDANRRRILGDDLELFSPAP